MFESSWQTAFGGRAPVHHHDRRRGTTHSRGARRRPSAATWRRPTMDPTDNTGKAGRAGPSTRAPDGTPGAAAPVAGDVADAAGVTGGQPFGPHAAQILATEHWSLLATRSLIWNEALSRAAVFLTVLSASIIALAFLADATGFGPQTRTLALVLLPVVFFLGVAAYARLVQKIGRAHV